MQLWDILLLVNAASGLLNRVFVNAALGIRYRLMHMHATGHCYVCECSFWSSSMLVNAAYGHSM